MPQAIDPTTGTILRERAPADASAIEAVLARAAAAMPPWRDLGFAARAATLRRVAGVLRERSEVLAMLMAEEMGKPMKEGRGEVEKSAWCCEHYAEHAAAYLAPVEIPSDATRSWVRHPPLGTVLGILPWNAPLWLAFRCAAPALMAGNTVILKHDPHLPGVSEALGEVFLAAGLGEGQAAMLVLDNDQVAAVIRDRRIHAISFTGSSRAGAAVAALAAAQIKPAVLELGGSDPAIVLADADLDLAADAIALMRIINAGQSCIAAKRILVEDAVHDAFVDRLRERLARLVVGDPREATTDIGPIARADLRDNLHRQVRSSCDQGARAVLGGDLPTGPGFFYPVTLLTGVTAAMTVFCEETFGPVACVTRVADAAEALRLANDTPYGLGASVFTTPERGIALAERIEAGQVAVNGVVKTDPRLPSGGIKRSGYGRELGPHGIRQFVNTQQIWVGPKR